MGSLTTSREGDRISSFSPKTIEELPVTIAAEIEFPVNGILALEIVGEGDFAYKLYRQGVFSESATTHQILINKDIPSEDSVITLKSSIVGFLNEK